MEFLVLAMMIEFSPFSAKPRTWLFAWGWLPLQLNFEAKLLEV
jgi:hypothetical protein